MRLPDPEWPYTCYTNHDWQEVCEWCEKTIGEFDKDWYKLGEDIAAQSINPAYMSTYMFKDERHAMLFKLKWYEGFTLRRK